MQAKGSAAGSVVVDTGTRGKGEEGEAKERRRFCVTTPSWMYRTRLAVAARWCWRLAVMARARVERRVVLKGMLPPS